MSTFVLVHGAWAGAWIWSRLAPRLRAAGHAVHAVTLTGVGERAHLRGRMQPPIDLATHVADGVGLVRAEELRGIVLVGHSYGGMVVTGMADQLERQAPGTVARMVYLDAVVPQPGESWSSTHDAKTVAERVAQAEAAGDAIPPADPKAFGLDGADRDWLLRRQTPQPLGTYRAPLAFEAARLAALPRLFIDCTEPALPTIAAARRRVRTEPGWQVVDIATGHCPQVSRPEELAAHLLAFAV